MKPKHKPKYIVLTDFYISMGEFKTKRDLINWIKQYKDKNRPIRKILTGNVINTETYLPIF